MNQTHIFDEHKRTKILAPVLARGGEGSVYPLSDRADILVKCYHPTVLAQQRHILQQKTEAMMRVKLPNSDVLSWPLISVFDEKNQWLGYAMQRKNGVKMHCLAHAVLYKRHFPQLNRRDMVEMLLGLVQQIQCLHQQGIMIGDYNLNNFLCDPANHHIYLIDCDSYQLTLAGKYYPCPVGSPDLTPVEHHNKPYSQVVRTLESESFSLAIILFKCLMLGRHPYDVVGGEDPVSNLRDGNFPYGQGGRGIPKGAWYNIWSHMPYQLKSLFVRTFKEGASNPSQRPTLKEWQDSLSLYLREMDKGWHELAICPSTSKSAEHRGPKSQTNA